MELRSLSARVEKNLADKFEAVAKLNDRSVSAELRMAVREYLASHGAVRRDFPSAEREKGGD